MPILAGKKTGKPTKPRQKAPRESTEDNNDGRPDPPEGYDENEDLLEMEIPPAPEQLMDADGTGGERLMISHIVVENFKSYFGRQIIGPFHKVCVLIHSSSGRDNIPSCTVSVHFQKITDKGRDNWEITAGSQFFVSRTAFRDNSSRYTLNGRPANFKDISLTLRQAGIDLVHNRFLILQGEVEQISLMKPKAENENEEGMLEYLEDIIGSSRFKLPIDKLLYKLDGIQEQRAAQLLRLKYAEKERVSLVEPVKELIAFLRLETASSLIKNKIFCCKKFKISQRLTELEEGQEQCLEKLSAGKSQLKEQSEQSKILNYEKREMEKQLDKFQQDSSRNDIDRLMKREKKIRDDIVKKEKQITDLKDVPEKAEAKIEGLKEALQEAEDQIKENSTLIEQKLNEIEEKTSSLKDKRKTLDAELAKHSVVEDEINSKLSLAQEELGFLQADEDMQHKVLAELNEKLADLKQNLSDRTRECNETHELAPKLVYEKAKLEAECASLRKKEAAIVDQIREIQAELEESKQSAEEFRSSNHLLQALMQQKQQGHILNIWATNNIVVDTVNTAQQCIEFLKRERMGTATFVALDKQQKFIPNMMNIPQTPENVPRLFDLIRVVDREVLPAFYFALNETLIADDIVAATRISMAGGRRWRTVTLKGEVVEVSGAMTGGGNSQRRGKIGQSVRVDTSKSASDSARDLSKLNQQLKELETKLLEVRQKLAKADDEFRHKKDELSRINKLSSNSKADVKNLEKSITHIQQQVTAQTEKRRRSIVDPIILEKAQNKVKSLKKESDEICQVTEALRLQFISMSDKIDTIEKQILGAEKTKLREAEEKKKDAEKSIANEKSVVASNKRNLAKAQKCMADLEADLEQTAKSIQLEQSKLCLSETNIEEMETLVTQHSVEIKKAEDSFKEAMAKGKELNAEELELQARINELNEKRQAVECKIKELNSKLAVIDKQISKLPFYSIKDLDGMPDEVKNTNNDKLLNSILSEEVSTDSIEHEDAEQRSFNSSNVLANEADVAEENLAATAISVEPKTSAVGLEKLPRYKGEVISQFDNETLEKQLNKLDELRSRSANKDACSMGVLNDYNDRVKSYNAESEVFQRISKQRDLHREFCQKLRNLRLNEFMTGFHKIGLALKDMYQMITMGGDASLDLVDSLDPFSEGISFGVRPPKKSWKQIVNLSGGEKTLASLAFVFGLHSYRPTPLYVMDEIDAALDFRNVSIISSYILEKTKNAQFVVISLRNNMFERGDRIVGIYKIHDCTQNAVLDPKAAERERKRLNRSSEGIHKKRVSGQSHEDRSLIAEISMNEDVDLDGITNEDDQQKEGSLQKSPLSNWARDLIAKKTRIKFSFLLSILSFGIANMVNQVQAFTSSINNLTGESTVKELVEFCKKWLEEAADRLSISDLDRLLNQVQLPRYTLGHTCLLLAKCSKLKNESDYIDFLTRVDDSLLLMNENQIFWAPDIYYRLFQSITEGLLAKNLSLHGIRLLSNAILKLTGGSTEYLTNIHASLFCLCLKARNFTEALPFFTLNPTEMFLTGSAFAFPGLNAANESSSSSSKAALNGCSPPPQAANSRAKCLLDAKSSLLYFYYGGMILCALERYNEALLFFEHGICLPAVRFSAIMLESFKKYILVSLIVGRNNPVAQLPSYKSSVIQRNALPLASVYVNLAQLVQKAINARRDVTAVVEVYMEQKRDVFERDQNLGLMKLFIVACKENAIKRLGNVFVSLHIIEVSRLSFIMNAEETESISRKLCYRDQNSVQYDQKTKTFRFNDTPVHSTSSSLVSSQQVEQALSEMIQLSQLIKNYDEATRVNPTYIIKQNKSVSGASGLFPEDEGFHASSSLLSSSPPNA
uniref:Structural maintenance of chromosomes protein 4 n=1 Tax=Ditylenchus dipsaci TaxID=166011 RepID=A0A915DJ13_9BILA